MGQYRRKLEFAEARMVTRRGLKHTAAWCNGTVIDGSIYFSASFGGTTSADVGDWIVRSADPVAFDAWTNDGFHANYEAVDNPAEAVAK